MIDDPDIRKNSFFLFEHTCKKTAGFWQHYHTAYNFYIKNKFEYQLNYNSCKNVYEYVELLNSKELYSLELNEDEWKILQLSNNSIIDKEQLKSFAVKNRIRQNKLSGIIDNLSKERIIYRSEIDGSIVSVIDTETISYEKE